MPLSAWGKAQLLLLLAVWSFDAGSVAVWILFKVRRKYYKWSSVLAVLQRNEWQQVFLTCITPCVAFMYQQMLLRVPVVVTPFNPCSHCCDGLYLHRRSWLIWSLNWQKLRQRKQCWRRKCTISFCSSTLFSFSYMPRLVRMLTLGLLRQNWWVWQLEYGIILIFSHSWLKFFLGRCE